MDPHVAGDGGPLASLPVQLGHQPEWPNTFGKGHWPKTPPRNPSWKWAEGLGWQLNSAAGGALDSSNDVMGSDKGLQRDTDGRPCPWPWGALGGGWWWENHLHGSRVLTEPMKWGGCSQQQGGSNRLGHRPRMGVEMGAQGQVPAGLGRTVPHAVCATLEPKVEHFHHEPTGGPCQLCASQHPHPGHYACPVPALCLPPAPTLAEVGAAWQPSAALKPRSFKQVPRHVPESAALLARMAA